MSKSEGKIDISKALLIYNVDNNITIDNAILKNCRKSSKKGGIGITIKITIPTINIEIMISIPLKFTFILTPLK